VQGLDLLLQPLHPQRQVGVRTHVLVGHLLHLDFHGAQVRLVHGLGLQVVNRSLDIGDLPVQQGRVLGRTAGGEGAENQQQARGGIEGAHSILLTGDNHEVRAPVELPC